MFSVLGIFFFRFRDRNVFVYKNEESDDVIGDFTKKVQHSIKNISRNILKNIYFKKQCSLRNAHHKRNKMTPVVPLL